MKLEYVHKFEGDVRGLQIQARQSRFYWDLINEIFPIALHS